MVINKINSNKLSYINFGKSKTNTADSTLPNKKKNNTKKVILALSALALAGVVYTAAKNPQISSKLKAIKDIIVSKSDITTPIDEAATKKAQAAVLGTAVAASSVAVASTVKKTIEQNNTSPDNGNPLKNIEVKKNASSPPIDDSKRFNFKLEPQISKNPNEDYKELLGGISYDEFIEAGGSLKNNRAYMGNDLFTGKISVDQKFHKYVLSYEQGELKKAVDGILTKDKTIEPDEIKEYFTEPDGTKVTNIRRRKYENLHNKTFSDTWYTSKIIKANKSKVEILSYSHFGDFTTTLLKKGKKGKWQGYREEYGFNMKKQVYEKVKYDIFTNKRLSAFAVKKLFYGS